MTAVKAEPDSSDIVIVQETQDTYGTKTSRSSITDLDPQPNRQALTSKSVNQKKITNNNKEKESQIRKFESFLLKPGQVQVINGDFQPKDRIKREKEQVAKSPVNSSRAAIPGIVQEENLSKRPAEKEIGQGPKKRRKELEEELSNFVGDRDEIVKQSGNPGEYVKINKLLCEPQLDENGSIFQELEHQCEKEFCIEASSWSLKDWVQNGQKLLNTQTRLVGKLVKHRIELSTKFQVITNAINDRADALNAQGHLIDEKLQRIKTLGEEILHII